MQIARRSTMVHSFGSNMNGVFAFPPPPPPPLPEFAGTGDASSSDSSRSVQSGEESPPPLSLSSSAVWFGGKVAASAARAAAFASDAGVPPRPERRRLPPLDGVAVPVLLLVSIEPGTITDIPLLLAEAALPPAPPDPQPPAAPPPLLLSLRGRLAQPCEPSAAPRTFIFLPPWWPCELSIVGERRAAIWVVETVGADDDDDPSAL